MKIFIEGLLTGLLWFLTLGGILCAIIIFTLGTIVKASWTWIAIFPLILFVVGEIIAYKLR